MVHSRKNADFWKALVARLSPSTRIQFMKFISLGDPPAFLPFVDGALDRARGSHGRSVLAKLLLERGILVQAISEPDLLDLSDATDLMKAALKVEPRFDLTLLRQLTDPGRIWPEDVPAAEMIRVLEVLRATTGVRPEMVMLMRRFLRVNDAQVRARAIKLASISYPAFVEAAFGDADPRVRSNLIESLCEELKELPTPARSLLQRGSTDSHHRVSTTALFYLARFGDQDSRRKLEQMLNHTDPAYRRAAAWAIGRLTEEQNRESSSAAPRRELVQAGATDPSEL